MKFFKIILSSLFAFILSLNLIQAQKTSKKGLDLVYVETSIEFSKTEKELIHKTISESEKQIRKLLPALPKNIKVIIEAMPRNIDAVGGTTGRAQKRIPDGEVYVYISSVYPGGIEAAVNASLTYTIHHEFHHLARGWTMEKNKYGPGIDIAMVNEGMAVVFAEVYTNQILKGNQPPKESEDWIKEILELPKDANYNTWMNQHPDGRLGIGYRSGNYLIRKAMKKSGKDIVELSKIEPQEILKLAGYSPKE